MASLRLNGSSSSSTARFYMFSLIILVFVCSFTYCSSLTESKFGISSIDNDNVDKNKQMNGEQNYHRLPFRFENDQLNSNEDHVLAKDRLLNILLNSVLNEDDRRPYRRYSAHLYNRRYAPQAFHAMRG